MGEPMYIGAFKAQRGVLFVPITARVSDRGTKGGFTHSATSVGQFRTQLGGVTRVTQVAIIGAGPYGLSIAAHLTALNVEHRIFGPPMDTWQRHVPAGMLLKSDGFASSLSEPTGAGTLAKYCSAREIPYHPTDRPVPVQVFNDYAMEFQRQYVPDLENRQVVSVDRSAKGFSLILDDGERLDAKMVVAAVGITHFAIVPRELGDLPAHLVSHGSEHHDLSAFADRDVTVIGAGASAVDIATLMSECGAKVSLVTRAPRIKFFSEPVPGPRSMWQRLKAPSSGLGPGWRSWSCQRLPQLFRFLPPKTRIEVGKRHLGPSSAYAMKARFESGVTALVNETIESAEPQNDKVRLVLKRTDGTRHEILTDHVVAATGYRPNIHRLDFLADGLRHSVRTNVNMPMVSGRFESSVEGLFFVGPPALDSFGPLMRFMVGAEYVAPVVANHLSKRIRRSTNQIRIASPA